jgi:medium-chain acyl-[acyl-carrier-protein] hydrolase
MNDAELLAKMKELNGTPEDILDDPDVLRFILPVLRADSELCETYEYVEDAALPCPITAFCGLGDNEETLDMMTGWRLQTSDLFSQHVLEGDHFFIHSNQEGLLKLLRTELCRINF